MMHRKMKQVIMHNDAIKATLVASDYNSFVQIFSELYPNESIPTQDLFSKIVERFELHSQIKIALETNNYELLTKTQTAMQKLHSN